jgi:SnoaL-like domain
MNDEQVLEQLGMTDAYAPATAMPEGAWGRDDAISEIERRIEMQTQTERTEHEETTRRWMGPAIAAAAFVVLIIVVGAVALLIDARSGGVAPADTTTPTPTTTASTTAATTSIPEAASPQVVVDAFFDALNTGDVETIVGLFSVDAVIGFGGPPGEVGVDDIHPDEFTDYFTWTVDSLPTAYEIDGCDVIDTHVSCRIGYTNTLLDAVLGEQGQQAHIFDIEDGAISQYYLTFGGRESSLVFTPFIRWVEQTHPEAMATVWRQDCCYTFPAFTEESAQRYRALVEEFVATR